MNRSVNHSVNRGPRSKPSPRRLNLPLTTKRDGFTRAPGRFRKPLTVVVAIYSLATSRLSDHRIALRLGETLAGFTEPFTDRSVNHSLEEWKGMEGNGSKEDMARYAWHPDLAIARASRDAMRSDQ